jgi:hypothetical protein
VPECGSPISSIYWRATFSGQSNIRLMGFIQSIGANLRSPMRCRSTSCLRYDPTAGEPLPRWPGRPVTADWRYPDPENLRGELWERRKEVAAMVAGLERQLRTFIQLPFRSLDKISLRERLSELSQGAEVG